MQLIASIYIVVSMEPYTYKAQVANVSGTMARLKAIEITVEHEHDNRIKSFVVSVPERTFF